MIQISSMGSMPHLQPNITIHRTSGKLRLPASGDFQRYAPFREPFCYD